MTTDPNRKTLRHFYCRDALWHSFERMSEDFDRGIDELVNEAMRLFAREKGYLPTENESPRISSSRPAVKAPPPPPPPRAVTPQPQPQPRTLTPPPPPPPPHLRTTSAFVAAGHPGGYGGGGPAYAPPPPPPLPQPGHDDLDDLPAELDGGGPVAPLYLVFQNQKYLIDKDQFIIGRGSKSSDLPIRDGNISRKHAAVVRRNGGYYIKDLGSTNGIDHQGLRVDNKRIEEGDVYTICDYELRFTYR